MNESVVVVTGAGATVGFLCTDTAEAITGQTLSVDGGLVFR